ncbi:MAG: alpha-amylase [Planctomycetota bacterium]|jgi:starch synthase (maltosyl-transferring)|nr:alpha-amylase [Planctomycetota bacterium]
MSRSDRPAPLIYNLFPPLVGDVEKWLPHIDRAADMSFNWCFLNPIHLVGASGSLYAVRDYFSLSPVFFPNADPPAQRARFKRFVQESRARGVEIMVDLVINHTAYDNPLTRDHRDWYKLNPDGKIRSPGCKDDQAPGGWTTWGDLSEIDNQNSSDRKNLWEYWWKLVEMFLDCEVRGFRCDAAYQIPNDLWKMLIDRARQRDPDACFFAETLGCALDQVVGLSNAGHDFVFNSGKWWDYQADWFIQQNNEMTKKGCRSICFPESHDTDRLVNEWRGDVDRIKQHYLFAALITSGVLAPLGFEYGFKKKLHVVKTLPHDYEGATYDLTDFLRQTNRLKKQYPLLSQDGILENVPNGRGRVLTLIKKERDGNGRMLMAFNRSGDEISFGIGDFLKNIGARPLATQQKELKLQRYGFALMQL